MSSTENTIVLSYDAVFNTAPGVIFAPVKTREVSAESTVNHFYR